MKFTIIRRKNTRSSCWRQRSKESPRAAAGGSAVKKAPGFEVVQIRGCFVCSGSRLFSKLGRLPFKCRRRVSGGIQRAEMIKMVEIAVKVPPEDIQRHSKGRNVQNS